MQNNPVICIDNGGGYCKIGLGGEPRTLRVFPNCSAKAKGERQVLIGDMLVDCKDIAQLSLKRPHDRGYIVNWDLEKDIWSRAFKSVLKLNPRDCGLLLSEPVFNFPSVRQVTEQVVFEEYGFQSFHVASAPYFSLLQSSKSMLCNEVAASGCGIVVDMGFSFTHVVPFFNFAPIMNAVKRINIGGKALTNYLKELVSYRSLNMMDETYLIELIKDQLCFVSQDLPSDLQLAKLGHSSPHRIEYVLPDGVHNLRGYVKERNGPSQSNNRSHGVSEDQILVLNNERFTVPELLFHPSDVGLDQAGLAEAVTQSLKAAHPALAPLLLRHVLLTGGMARCPGLEPRFTRELRSLVCEDYELNVATPKDPMTFAWLGMSEFVASGKYAQEAMTKAEYEEQGTTSKRAH